MRNLPDIKVVVKVYPKKMTPAELRELTDKLQHKLDKLELGEFLKYWVGGIDNGQSKSN